MSDIKTLEIPKWGLSMEEGTIAQWLLEEGQSFDKGDDICEIETTKIVNVLEAPFASTLRKIVAQPGDTLLVGGIIAICADASVSDAEIATYLSNMGTSTDAVQDTTESLDTVSSTQNDASQATTASAPVTTAPASSAAATVSSAPASSSKTASKQDVVIPTALQGYQAEHGLFTTPHADQFAAKYNINLSQVTGTGRENRISVNDLQSAVHAAGGQWPAPRQQLSQAAKSSHADDSDLEATPVARRLAKTWGINLHDCRRTGSRGRICKADVEAVYDRQRAAQAVSQGTATDIVAPATTAKFSSTAMSAMRKAIASRLQAAKRNAPHFRLTVDLNVEALQSLRAQINATVPQVKLSINDMLIKATAAALMKVPQVNVQFDEENQQILQFDQADIAIAVAIDAGLITPIIKAANRKSMAEISADMLDLATRAKTGKLAADEFQGGSFSISNLGMLGVKQFDAIINPPQGAILALGTSEARAVVVDGVVQVQHMMTATLSCDHRVIDGALGAKFLASLKQFVENPALILV